MELISQVVIFFETSKYFLIFLGSFFEGTAVMLASGLLWREGTVQFWPMYVALVAGDFLSDMAWYFIGYVGGRPFIHRWGHLFKATPDVIKKIERRFKRHRTLILIVSKLTMGFGLMIATLLTAGMLRVSVVAYALIEFLGGLIWILFLILIGYYFGNVLDYIPHQLQIALLVIAIPAAVLGVRYINTRLAEVKW
jgi:membrane protein DedA with SNARE-associated domain